MFGVIGDPHIRDRSCITTLRLREKVDELNKLDLNFVLVTGDLSSVVKSPEGMVSCIDGLLLAKEILDGLHAKHYCCHGNHDYSFDGKLNLSEYIDIFGPPQYAVQVNGYNLIVLKLETWRETPLEINRELPSIVLIHYSSKTAQSTVFPSPFDNPDLDDFLELYGVETVFHGHIHFGGRHHNRRGSSEQKDAWHRGVQYINCSNQLWLGCLGPPVIFAPVMTTMSGSQQVLHIEEAQGKMRTKQLRYA